MARLPPGALRGGHRGESEVGHESAAIMTECIGPDAAFMDGDGMISNMMVLMHRAMSIATLQS